MNNLTTFYIVRHGQSEGNANHALGVQLENTPLGSSLTPLGIDQAKNTAMLLGDIHFDKVISSNLTRAHMTAKILAEEKDLLVETTELLKERSRGKIVGDLEKKLAKRLGNIFNEMELMTTEEQVALKNEYGIELRDDTTARVLTFLRETAVGYPGNTLLLVTHGAVMRSLLVHLGYGTAKELGSGAIKNAAYFSMKSDGVDFFLGELYNINKVIIKE